MAKAKWEHLMDYIELDENGCSRIYPVDEIIEYGDSIGIDLSFGNGSSYARTDTTGKFQRKFDYVLIKENGFNYNIPHFDKQGKLIPKGTGKTIAIQILGFMTDEKWALRSGQTHDHTIPEKIRQACFKRDKCCVFTGATTNLECDHKNGRYPKSSSEITVDDVQTVCKAINDMKREVCKNCVKTNKRYDARQIGYPKGWAEGDENFISDNLINGCNGCKGCYLHDPIEFRKKYMGDINVKID